MEFQFKSHFRRLTWFLPTLKLWRVLVHGVTFRAAPAVVSAGFQCCPNHCLPLLWVAAAVAGPSDLFLVTFFQQHGGEKKISASITAGYSLALQAFFSNVASGISMHF